MFSFSPCFYYYFVFFLNICVFILGFKVQPTAKVLTITKPKKKFDITCIISPAHSYVRFEGAVFFHIDNRDIDVESISDSL